MVTNTHQNEFCIIFEGSIKKLNNIYKNIYKKKKQNQTIHSITITG